jgi:hypothetical protein
MRHISSLKYPILLFCFALVLVVAGCRKATEAREADNAPAASTATASAEPKYVPEATVKDIMQAVVDTSADTVWLSVTTISTDKGLIETKPKNDEEWTKVRHGALTLAEAANLLMIPGRHVARAGEKSDTPGVELEPSEMEVLINKDRPAWIQRATALHDAAMLAVKAADEKDAEKVFEVGENIEQACENCHRQYWYPNEKIPELPKL